MGGKVKQAQRTKNNARPSSSGRSAELLQGAGGALFPSLASTAPAPGLNPDLALLVKKLNKKDPITKAKALQELNELIKNSDVEEVVALLPNWTHFYKTLSIDSDRKVRELTQLCHGTIVSICGRRIAPWLRTMLPCWLTAQYDDHGPAQARAKHSLHATFPDNKLGEAISFCKTEVMAHILDNVLNSDAGSGKKTDSDIECERLEASSRAIAGGLRALTCVLRSLTPSHTDWLWEQLTQPVGTNAFWKLAQHSGYHVRTSWYSTIAALASRFGTTWVRTHGARAIKVLVHTHDTFTESHTRAVRELIRADTEIIDRLENIDKLTSRIIQTVSSGGWGDSRALMTSLHDLLDALPNTAINTTFIDNLIDATLEGFNKRNVVTAKTERFYWLLGLKDLIAKENVTQDSALRALRLWLEVACRDKSAIKQHARVLALLVSKWVGSSPVPALLLRGFWMNVSSANSSILAGLTKPINKDVLGSIKAHVLLMKELRDALAEKPTKQSSIKFADETESPEVEAQQQTISEPAPLDESLYLGDLTRAEDRMCGIYLEFGAESDVIDDVIECLLPLLRRFNGERFASLSQTFGGTTPIELYTRAIQPWLSSKAKGRHVVELALILLQCLNEEQRDLVMKSIDELGQDVAEWCVEAAVGGACPPVGGASVKGAWLSSPPAVKALPSLADRATRDQRAADVLRACILSESLTTETLIATAKTLATSLEQAQNNIDSYHRGASLAAILLPYLPSPSPLLPCLLKYVLIGEKGDEFKDCCAAIRKVLVIGDYDSTLKGIVDVVYEMLDNGSVEISRIAELCPYLISEGSPANEVTSLVTITLREDKNSRKSIENAAAVIAALTGYPSVLLNPPKVNQSLIYQDLKRYSRDVLLRAEIYQVLLENGNIDELLKLPVLRDLHLRLLYDAALIKHLKDGYKFWSHYPTLDSTHTTLQSQLQHITALTSSCDTLVTALSVRAVQLGGYWALAMPTAGTDSGVRDSPVLGENISGDGFFHMMQVQASQCPDGPFPIQTSAVLARRALLAAGVDVNVNANADVNVNANADDHLALEAIVDAHYRHPGLLLVDSSTLKTRIHSAPWANVEATSRVIALSAMLVQGHGWDLPSHHWDFITLSLAGLMNIIYDEKEHFTNIQVASIAIQTLRLLKLVDEFIKSIPSECQRRQPTTEVAVLPREWQDVFWPDISSHFDGFLVYVLENSSTSQETSPSHAYIAESLTSIIRCLPLGRGKSDMGQIGVIARAAGQVMSVYPQPVILGLAYTAMIAVLEEMVVDDVSKLSSESEQEQELSLVYFEKPLSELADRVEAALDAADLNDEDDDVLDMETQRLALSYLLCAEALFTLLDIAATRRGGLVLRYTDELRDPRVIERILPTALRLLPVDLQNWAYKAGNERPAPQQYLSAFTNAPNLDIGANCQDLVHNLACRVLYSSLRGASSVVRGWCGAAGAAVSKALKRIASEYISPCLIKELLTSLPTLPDTTIKVTGYELTAVTLVDDQPVTLTLQLAKDHPLTPAKAQAPKHGPGAGGPTLLVHRGLLSEALRLWVRALLARVEAAPCCYICYCRVQDGRLPAVTCRQCKNAFHTPCLRKWFASSNKSNCPLCRAGF